MPRGVGGDVEWMNEKERERERKRKGEGREKYKDGKTRGAMVGVDGRRQRGRKRGSEQLATVEARAALIFSRDRTRKPFYAHPRLIIRRTRKMKRPRTKRSRAVPPGNAACPLTTLARCHRTPWIGVVSSFFREILGETISDAINGTLYLHSDKASLSREGSN